MFCRSLGLRSSASMQQFRPLSPGALLTVIRNEPGESAKYYALRYFGPVTEAKVKHILWSDLKKFGHVSMERDRDDDPPRWYPNRYQAPTPPVVKPYRPEEWDLSVLKRSDEMLQASGAMDVVEQMKYEAAPASSGDGPTPAAIGAPGRWVPPSRPIAPPLPPPRTVPRKTKPGSWEADLNSLATSALGTEALGARAESAMAALDAPSQSAPPTLAAGSGTVEQTKANVVALVRSAPGKDIHYYINKLEDPAQRLCAPALFKDLRTAGLLARTEAAEGGFVWNVV